ncbi:hypothetical protein [Aeromonas sp. S19(2024)]|uniref:hypothetical protein n=1 Tax=Aeromonas sp. S19(2024) TaxID=3242892 RepID=UPI003529041A
MNREVFQKQYDFELEQRNGIASATNTPIVALTILGGALSAVTTEFKYSNEPVTYLFLLFVTLAIGSMLISVYKLVRTLLGYSYQKIPPAKQLRKHLDNLKKWHNENGSSEDGAVTDFDEYFDEKLSEAAEHNSTNNIKRGNYLHDATLFVVVSFVFLFCASPFYIYEQVTSENMVYQVNLIDNISNKEEEIMANNDSGSSNQGQQAAPRATPSQTPSAAPKPTGPQNVVFKGNTDGGKTSASDSGPKDNK